MSRRHWRCASPCLSLHVSRALACNSQRAGSAEALHCVLDDGLGAQRWAFFPVCAWQDAWALGFFAVFARFGGGDFGSTTTGLGVSIGGTGSGFAALTDGSVSASPGAPGTPAGPSWASAGKVKNQTDRAATRSGDFMVFSGKIGLGTTLSAFSGRRQSMRNLRCVRAARLYPHFCAPCSRRERGLILVQQVGKAGLSRVGPHWSAMACRV